MGSDEIMIAVGIGCRRGASADSIVEIVRQALARTDHKSEAIELFTIDDKRDEAGLLAAAAELRLPLTFLSRAALQGVEDRIVMASRQAKAAFDVASVSEAASLAGAGRDAVLVVARIARQDVTCAVARGDGK
ncbi:cobalamin biosynthesis protein CobE [Methylovirgula ligni]|uniref:Cobalt-precorrin 5A hydrolase n=1 Tax=Methylovirgula ligni TaxID=569860 RepID=A0A3D9Z317_9HYPH|nr:cobalamin biosynthesis protein [Methylovirgula ligni]QAY95447.1 cobalamin biosynthesis protein CobE [Methylovirgula ligni]REF89225.1 cobalt-precorrin 5A hydrolase [Methylovirgula ligni]